MKREKIGVKHNIVLNLYPSISIGSQILHQATLVLHWESTQLAKRYLHIRHTRNVHSRGDTGRLPGIRGGLSQVLAMLAVHIFYTEPLCNCTNTHDKMEYLLIVWFKSSIPHMVHFKMEYHNRWHWSIIWPWPIGQHSLCIPWTHPYTNTWATWKGNGSMKQLLSTWMARFKLAYIDPDSWCRTGQHSRATWISEWLHVRCLQNVCTTWDDTMLPPCHHCFPPFPTFLCCIVIPLLLGCALAPDVDAFVLHQQSYK